VTPETIQSFSLNPQGWGTFRPTALEMTYVKLLNHIISAFLDKKQLPEKQLPASSGGSER